MLKVSVGNAQNTERNRRGGDTRSIWKESLNCMLDFLVFVLYERT